MVHNRNKLLSRVKSEILVRMSKGYENLSLDEVNVAVKMAMKEINVV